MAPRPSETMFRVLSVSCISEAVPSIPCDAEGPVFREPWEAQAFAMALALHERGLFTWPQWAATLADMDDQMDELSKSLFRHSLTLGANADEGTIVKAMQVALLARHYDSPTWLVRLQIILNLQHDPDTSADVMAEVMQTAAKGEASVRRLLREAIGTDVRRANTEAVFHALRGFATSVQLSAAVPVDGSRRRSQEAVRIFLRGLADAEETYAGP